MKLQYSILWFDDSEEFLESFNQEPAKKHLRSLGFSAQFTMVSDPVSFMAYEPFSDFDLIIVDFDLAEYEAHGQDFIEKIRDHGVFTEIIFFSGNPASDIWGAIKDKKLEGIFVANRGTINTKIQKVVSQSVRKVLDLENMRGIVMAEVGENDLRIEEILHLGVPQLGDEERSNLFKKFYEDAITQVGKNGNNLEGFQASPSVEALCQLSDSDKKYSNLCRLLKAHPKLATNDLGCYRDDVLAPRNSLAHGIPVEKDDGQIAFQHRGKELEFTTEVALDLRLKIMSYKQEFDSIKEKITSHES
ncbi:response regulator [Shewanella insulae]|uniref:response regulator n=1 Tax=Shewanella insulae TaxID=2681496 RepID=UPI001EFDE1DA|nr:response regulator [Shewanella insulae]MCG9738767.1 response regulator [Shewanella insulae]